MNNTVNGEKIIIDDMRRIFILLSCLNAAFICCSRAQERRDTSLPPAYLIKELVRGTDAAIRIRIDSVRRQACTDCTSTGLLYAVYYSPVKVLRSKYKTDSTHRFFTADDASNPSGLYGLPARSDLIVFLLRLPRGTFAVKGEVWFAGLPDTPGAFYYDKRLEKLIPTKRTTK